VEIEWKWNKFKSFEVPLWIGINCNRIHTVHWLTNIVYLTETWCILFDMGINFILFIPCIFSLSYISLTNQCTLIILYYTIQFTVKLVRHVSSPYFGIIIRDLDCELHKLQINWDSLKFNFCIFKMYHYCWFVICVIHNPSPWWWSQNRDSKHVGLVLW
jgi:hypothetical protein